MNCDHGNATYDFSCNACRVRFILSLNGKGKEWKDRRNVWLSEFAFRYGKEAAEQTKKDVIGFWKHDDKANTE